jgi:tetratricopeptide (TPR) repeat protein
MDNKNEKNTSIIPIGSTGLVRAENSISITNKIFNERSIYLFNKGFYYRNTSKLIEGETNYYEIIKSNPNYPMQKGLIGKVKNFPDDFESAIRFFKEALIYDANNPIFLHFLAASYANVQRYNEAIDFYTKAIHNNDKYANAFANRGVSWLKINDYPNAISDFSKALELEPNFKLAYKHRATAKIHMGDVIGAKEDLLKSK